MLTFVLYVEEFAASILSSLVYFYFISNKKEKKGIKILLNNVLFIVMLFITVPFYSKKCIIFVLRSVRKRKDGRM